MTPFLHTRLRTASGGQVVENRLEHVVNIRRRGAIGLLGLVQGDAFFPHLASLHLEVRAKRRDQQPSVGALSRQ